MSLELIKKLTTLNQVQLSKLLIRFLREKGYINIKKHEHFILAEGRSPICLIAHMDTVFRTPQRIDNFIYDQELHILWGAGGSGFDDRVGIAAIIEILDQGFRPHILFTDLEECGGMGAEELVTKYSKWPFQFPCHALVELDRANRKDAVFYSCENTEFIKYIESFGFEYDIGSFSDISIIMPRWKIAGVNLSIGYCNEHSPNEILHLDWYNETIEKVKNILLKSGNMKHYKYVARSYYHMINFDEFQNCLVCGTQLNKFNRRNIFDEEFPYSVCTSCYNKYYATDETPFDFY